MSKWITYDYQCPDCQTTEIRMLDRDNTEEIQNCGSCGHEMERIMSASICRVSYPDGVVDRFKAVKEQRKLEKELRKAKKAGNKDEVARIKKESQEVRIQSAKNKQIENICKAKPVE